MYDRLFELIRNEEVVLFVGAGFSINAGYPSGKDLCQIIYDELTDSEKANISQNLSLIDLTDEFIQLRGNSRNPLISKLKSIYGKIPVDLSDHKKIKSIPHFKNIITTNYDNSFENVYSDNHNLLFKDADCSYIDKLRTNVFKIHGDLSVPESIVITKSDYRHYFDKENNTIFWTKIKDLLASNSVLFIGYSFEDDNIISIVDSINNALGANRKEMFLIAPDWKDHKKQKISSFGVKYFNDTANNFLYQLIENIKGHIKNDFDNKRITSETFTQFCENYTISPIVNLAKNKNAVVGVKSINNQLIEGKLTFRISEDIAQQIYRGDFEETNLPIKIKGNDVSTYPAISIPVEKIYNYEYRINDIVFSDKEDIRNLYLVKVPNNKGELTIKTPDNDLYTNIDYELFVNNNSKSIFKAYTLLYKLTINFKSDEFSDELTVNWQTEFKDTYRNKITAIYWTNLLIKLYQGGKFSFYLDEHEIIENVPTVVNKEDAIEKLKTNIDFYENIEKIEKLAKTRFSTYCKFTEKNYEYSNIALKYLRKEFELIPAKNYKSSFEFLGDETFTTMINENPDGRFFLFHTSELKEPIVLNGYKFKIRFKNVVYINCKILNISHKDNGAYFIDFENEGDYIQVSYTENAIRQEGLEIKFFD